MLSKIDLLALPPSESYHMKQISPKKITNQFDDGYVELMDEFSLHQFVIRKGKALDTTPEFISFKRSYLNQWAGISFMIHLLEKLLTERQVPHAIVNGKSLAKLAASSIKKPSVIQLYDCLSNTEEVQ
jgi:IQ domain-containing protein H